MIYSDDFLKKLTTLGSLGYPPQKCINILEVQDERQFIADFFDKQSPVCKAYQKGVDIGDYTIDSKLMELAKTGDINAIKELKARQKVYSHELNEQSETQRFRNNTE